MAETTAPAAKIAFPPDKCIVVFKRFLFLSLFLVCAISGAFAQSLPRVVILPLENRAGERHANDVETITEMLSGFITGTLKLNVIDRMVLNATMTARRWRMSDWEDIDKTAEMGRVLNASYIVRGSVSLLGENLFVTARLLDIASAETVNSITMQLDDISDAYVKMNSLAQLLTYSLSIPVQPEPAQPPPPAQAAAPPEPEPPPQQQPAPPPAVAEASPVLLPEPVTPDADRAARLNTLGVSTGTAFSDPLLIITLRGTFAPMPYLFLEAGIDFGIISMYADAEKYYSLYPFVHMGFFVPFGTGSGWYIGAGGGYMFGEYTFRVEGKTPPLSVFAADFITGFTVGGFLDISYTLRTDFASASNKLAIGFVYRF